MTSTHDLEAFFSHGKTPCELSPAFDLPPASSNTTTPRIPAVELLLAPDASGSTSLLLQRGFSLASEGCNVLLILHSNTEENSNAMTQTSGTDGPEIAHLEPCHQCGAPAKVGADNLIWQRIQIKYLHSASEIQELTWSLSMMEKQVNVLLIDSFDRFFPSPAPLPSVYPTLAYLYEALGFMQSSSPFATIVLSCDPHASFVADTDPLLRWCTLLYINSTDASDEFILQATSTDVPSLCYHYVRPTVDSDGYFRFLRFESSAKTRIG